MIIGRNEPINHIREFESAFRIERTIKNKVVRTLHLFQVTALAQPLFHRDDRGLSASRINFKVMRIASQLGLDRATQVKKGRTASIQVSGHSHAGAQTIVVSKLGRFSVILFERIHFCDLHNFFDKF